MALIRDSEGRSDGSYYRITDSEELSILISKIHSTSIRYGNELEEVVKGFTKNKLNETELEFLNNYDFNNISKEFFVLFNKKDILKLFQDVNKDFKSQPDFLYFSLKDKKIFVIELKDGDNFDTKKSDREISVLENCVKVLSENENLKDFDIDYRFCSFNAIDNAQVKLGLKNKIDIYKTLTGLELSNMFGFNFDDIVYSRKKDAFANRYYIMKSFYELKETKKFLKRMKYYKKTSKSRKKSLPDLEQCG